MNNTVSKLVAAASKLTPFPKYCQPPAPIPFLFLLLNLEKYSHIYTLKTCHNLWKIQFHER